MASVTPRRSARTGVVSWRVQFRVGGRMSQESFEDKRSADEFGKLVDRVGGVAARVVLDARRGNVDGAPTLRAFTERYLDASSGLLTGIEPGTRSDYVRIAQQSFLPLLGEYPITALTKTDVGRWIAWQESQPSKRRDGPLAAKTVKNYHSLLSAVLAAAVDEGITDKNVAYRTRLTRGIRHEGVFLSRDEFATLLHFIPDHYQVLVLFLAGTGLRWGEATALTWGDVSRRSTPATVRIDKAWKKAKSGGPVLGPPKTARSRRTVSMHASLSAALGEAGPADQLLFRGPLSGKHLWYGRFSTSIWNPAVTKAMDHDLCVSLGLTPLTRKPTPHDLRHTHASWLIAASVPLPYVQARLGHESITTTVGTYGHLVPDAHEQMSTVIEATLDGVSLTPLVVESAPARRELESLVDDIVLDLEPAS